MTHTVVTFDNISGRVAGAFSSTNQDGSIPDDLLDRVKLSEGFSNVLLDCDHSTLPQHYIDIETKTLVEMPTRPTEPCVFDYTTKQWVSRLSIADVKATRREYVNAERLKANQSSFTFDGKQISTDTLARSDIDAVNGLVALTGAMPQGWIGAWKAVDNTYVSVPDVATWNALYSAMVAQGLANFAHAQDLKAQIDAATTIAEVNAISW